MTNREKTEQNLRDNGIELTINEKNILSWVALNGDFQMVVKFDDNGNWLDSNRIWLK